MGPGQGGVKDAWSITKGPVIGESVGNKSKTPSSSKAAASSKQQAVAKQPQAAKLEASAAVARADSRSLALLTFHISLGLTLSMMQPLKA